MTREQIIQEAHLGNIHCAENGNPIEFLAQMHERYPDVTREEIHLISQVGQATMDILDYEKEE